MPALMLRSRPVSLAYRRNARAERMTPAASSESAAIRMLAPMGTVTRAFPSPPQAAARTIANEAIARPHRLTSPRGHWAGSGSWSACCSSTVAASASTSPFRPRVEPPISRMARCAAAVVKRSSTRRTGKSAPFAKKARDPSCFDAALVVLAGLVERQPDDEPLGLERLCPVEYLAHRRTLPRPPRDVTGRRRDRAGRVADGEPDASVTEVDSE